MATWAWILIIIAIVIVIGVIAMADRRRRTAVLRQRFGPEYDRAVESRQDRRAAEADLRARERQRARLDIKPLPEATRLRFAQEWHNVQEGFIDQPAEAVVAADRLVNAVMAERGYPMGDFDAQADLVSVDHPEVVDNYRFAHGIHEQAQARQASTEDLREALVRYRSLFDELLVAETTGPRSRPGAGPPASRTGQAAAPAPSPLPMSRHGRPMSARYPTDAPETRPGTASQPDE